MAEPLRRVTRSWQLLREVTIADGDDDDFAATQTSPADSSEMMAIPRDISTVMIAFLWFDGITIGSGTVDAYSYEVAETAEGDTIVVKSVGSTNIPANEGQKEDVQDMKQFGVRLSTITPTATENKLRVYIRAWDSQDDE